MNQNLNNQHELGQQLLASMTVQIVEEKKEEVPKQPAASPSYQPY
jgi:hypothetical protein